MEFNIPSQKAGDENDQVFKPVHLSLGATSVHELIYRM
jgi:hypothetical protein